MPAASPAVADPGALVRTRVLDATYRRLVRPTLFASYGGDPERVHEVTLAAIARLGESRIGLRVVAALTAGPRQPVTVAGVEFPGIVGLAAGLDKNGVGLKAWSALGFGHAELGTVTAGAQPGNPQPRLFRLPESQAIVNRMGFNNRGAQALADELDRAGARRGNGAVGMPIGVSIGKTRATPLERAAEDYLTSFRLLAPYADYVAVNVSSPNTAGLRSLQDRAALHELVVELVTEARTIDALSPVPVFVKIAPDLGTPALDEVLSVCVDGGAAGLIATNTTLAREGVSASEAGRAHESGGLSGAPLAGRAREVVRYLAGASELPVIGVGGILSADDALAMLDAGARLVQVYTGYIYRGPALVTEINRRVAAGGPRSSR